MTETLKLNVDRRDGLAVIYTEGYINNQGGEEIARAAYELIGEGYRRCCCSTWRAPRSSTRSASRS